MRWDRLLFGAFLALGLVVSLLIVVVPEAADERGRPHPDFSSMSQGGAGERHQGLLGWGYAFGALSIVIFAAFVALGASRKGGGLRGLGRHLVWSTALLLAVWTLLMLAYRDSLDNGGRGLWLYFPVVTALMLYLFYPLSTLYNLLFVAGFERWVLSEEDRRTYRELVERGDRDAAE